MRYVRCERGGVVPPVGCPHAPHAASPPPTRPPAHPPTHPPPLPSHSAWACPWRYRYRWAGVGFVGARGCWTPRGWGMGVGERASWLNRGFSAVSGAVLGIRQELYLPPRGALGHPGVGTPRRWAGTTLCPPGCGPCRHPRRLQPPRTSPPRRAFGLRPKPPQFCPCDALGSVRHGFPPLPYALSEGFSPPRVGTYFCVRTFWPRPRVTVPNVAPGFRLPAALLEGMASRVPRTFVFQTLASASGIGAQCRTWVRGHNLMSGGGGGMGGQLQGGALP